MVEDEEFYLYIWSLRYLSQEDNLLSLTKTESTLTYSATASKDILRRCPLDKVTIIWYDECLLHYSNQSIFATINEVLDMFLISTQNITGQRMISLTMCWPT
ncbi:cysteine-rich receptor-like protein kinase 25 [Quercus suber]|uniref:Cysteine-rich receptor-like protein kinase 25 n=1 Tax=Quercus suber TaxID=58331 RepID=A0AAW0K3S6_QUESU